MAEERQIDAISIGIGANVSGLKASLEAAQGVVNAFKFKKPKDADFNLNIGLNTTRANTSLNTFIKNNKGREIPLSIKLIPTRESMRDFRALLKTQLTQGEDFRIPFKADLRSARTIRNSIQTALNQTPFTIQIGWVWKNGPPPAGGGGGGGGSGGGGGGGGGAPTSPPRGTPAYEKHIDRVVQGKSPALNQQEMADAKARQSPPPPGPTLVTRPARPVAGRSGGPVQSTPIRPVVPGGLPPRYAPAPSRSNTELAPGVGAVRPSGTALDFQTRLKRALALMLQTGNRSHVDRVLGPFQSDSRNITGIKGEQINVQKLIEEAKAAAIRISTARGGGGGPLREYDEYVPKNVAFNPFTIDTSERAISSTLAFAKRARDRAASSGGVYSDTDVHIADQRRKILNRIQTQLHAEDPKAFQHAFGVHGSITRIKDFGLMSLAQLSGARAAISKIGPPTPDFLEAMAGSERHNKQLAAQQPERVIKRLLLDRAAALKPDREGQTFIDEATGKKRIIRPLGLPFAQKHGRSGVDDYVRELDERITSLRAKIPGRAGGGFIGNVGYASGGYAPGFSRFRSLLSPYFPNTAIALPDADRQTEDILEDVAARFSSRYPRSASHLSAIRMLTPTELATTGPQAAGGTRSYAENRPGEAARIISSIAINPRVFNEGLGAYAAHDYGNQISGFYSRVPKRFAGLGNLVTHELGHVLDLQNISPGGTLPSDFLHASIASRYGSKNSRENLAEHFTRHLLGGESEDSHDLFMSLSREESGFAKGGRMGRRMWGKSGAYVVGEQGDEVFVPESAGWIIPHRLMDQLPKRAGGQYIPGGNPINPSARRAAMASAQQAQSAPAGPVPAGPAPGPTGQPVTAQAGGPYGQHIGQQISQQLGINPASMRTARQDEEEYFRIREEAAAVSKEEAVKRAKVSQSVSQAAARAFGPDVGQIAATVGGRGGVIFRRQLFQESQKLVTSTNAHIVQLLTQQSKLQKLLNDAINEGDVDKIDKINVALGEQADRVSVAREHLQKYQETSAVLGENVAGLGAKFKTLTSNFSGILAGTLIYGTVFRGISAVLGQVIPATASYIDEQTGLHSKATAVTSALAAQTKAAHGNADAVLATSAAEAGLNQTTLELLSNRLKLTAQVKAGGIAQGAASDLFRGASGVKQGTPEGLFGGYGGILGSPFLAGLLGGGKGFSEIIQGDLSALSKRKGSDPFSDIGSGLSYLTNGSFRDVISAQAQKNGNVPLNLLGAAAAIPGEAGNAINDLLGATNPFGENFGNPYFQGDKRKAEAAQAAVIGGPTGDIQGNQLVQSYLDSLTNNIQKGGGTAKFEYTSDQGKRLEGEKAAALAGDLNGVSSAAQGYIITLNGAVAGTKEYTTAIEQAAKGAPLMDASSVIAATQRQREITANTIAAQSAYQTQVSLPQQAALQYYSNLPLAPGTGIVPGGASAGSPGYGGFSANPQLAGTQFGKYTSMAKTALDSVEAYAAQGMQTLLQQGVSPELLNSVTSLGKSIHTIQTDLAGEQAVQTAVQYNHQLFITNRQLQDAAGLAGRRVTNEGQNLGVLQRQSFLLERQSTSLSLGMSQRQINFQTAVASFQAPGVSGEERAARMEEAKLEAAYAQKQLNIQKKQFTIGGQVFNISAVRQLRDVQFALQDLQQGHKIQVDAAAAQQTIAALQGQMTNATNLIGAQISKNEAIFSAQINEAAQVAASATGTAFNEIFKGVNEAWKQYTQLYVDWRTMLSGGGSGSNGNPSVGNFTGGGSGRDESGGPGQAAGTVFNTSGRTSLTVGEAGTEHVAVLRSPHTMDPTSFGGGGGGNFIVQINNPVVKDENDIQAIVAAVERAMQKRAAMTLPRRQ